MTTYSIKLTENKSLLLTNESGEVVTTTDILHLYPSRRVYAMRGQMGAGKTTFIRQLCAEMGSPDVVNSPTFAIVNVYDLPRQHEEIYHFDCYRLKSIAEAVDFGAEEYLYSGNYCFIEWPDILEPLLPDDTVYIDIENIDDTTRHLTIH